MAAEPTVIVTYRTEYTSVVDFDAMLKDAGGDIAEAFKAAEELAFEDVAAEVMGRIYTGDEIVPDVAERIAFREDNGAVVLDFTFVRRIDESISWATLVEIADDPTRPFMEHVQAAVGNAEDNLHDRFGPDSSFWELESVRIAMMDWSQA